MIGFIIGTMCFIIFGSMACVLLVEDYKENNNL